MSIYISLADAAIYFTTQLNTELWDESSDPDKTAALTMATEAIDQLNYLGEKTDTDQVNQFPRDADTIVPSDIQYACAEIALKLLDGIDMELELENQVMISQGYANVRSTYNRSTPLPHIVAGIASVKAWRLLKPYLRDGQAMIVNRVS